MPQFSYPVPDIQQMITRPVIMSVVRQIIEATGIDESIFIQYTGEHTQTPIWNTFLGGDALPQEDPTRSPYMEKIQVETDENPLEEFLLSTPYHYPDNKILWHDESLGIILTPFYERAEVNINFTYRTPDKGSATRWATGMRRRFRTKFKDLSMVASYQFILPRLIVNFMHQFWKMRENIAGYDQSWDDWFKSNLKQRVVTMGTVAGTGVELAFDEMQLDILGSFDFTDIPKAERQEDSSCYNISFSFKFRFDRPNGYVLKYPLIIHNQLVPAKYRPRNPHRYDPHAVLGNASQSMSRYDTILQDCGVTRKSQVGGHLVPWFDDWSPNKGYKNCSPLLQLLTRIEADDPTKLIDFLALRENGLHFSDITEKYMRDEYRYLNKHSKCALHVAVYVNDDLLDPSAYYVTKELTVRLRTPADMRNMYHVVVFILNDLFALDAEATERLQYNPDAADEIITTLEPTLKDCLPKRLANKLIPRDEWQRVVSKINTSSKMYGRKYFLMRPTVLGSMLVVDGDK